MNADPARGRLEYDFWGGMGVPVVCPVRWIKNPGISLVFGSHNAEVEGLSPSLTTNQFIG